MAVSEAAITVAEAMEAQSSPDAARAVRRRAPAGPAAAHTPPPGCPENTPSAHAARTPAPISLSPLPAQACCAFLGQLSRVELDDAEGPVLADALAVGAHRLAKTSGNPAVAEARH